MERSKYICCLLTGIFLICVNTAFTQSVYSKKIYDTYIQGRMDNWVPVMQQMEAANPASLEEKLELLNYYYGYTGYMVGIKKAKEAVPYIEKGEKLIEQILRVSPDNASALAYKGSFLGFKIANSKIKAVTLGPEAMKAINKAYQIDPSNIQALADKGNMLYYAPSVFGGDKKLSLQFFEKGISIMESKRQTKENWFYLYLLVSLARRQEENGMRDQALATYRKILRIEPGFQWVRDELYPDLLKKQ